MREHELKQLQDELIECNENLEICDLLLKIDKSDFCNQYKNFPKYPLGMASAEKALGLLHGKWKHAILLRLLKHPQLRYSELKRELEEYGITDYMLASSLNELVNDKLLVKTVYAEVPARVEYSITEKTVDLWYIILQLAWWYNSYKKEDLEELIKNFDE